jgi:SAM-dependent methyltransferase
MIQSAARKLVRKITGTVAAYWQRVLVLYASFRPDLLTQQAWLNKSRWYWLSGYKEDPRGPVNFPETYWESISYTPHLLNAVKNISGASSFLELGCNSGRNLYALLLQYPNAIAVGIDINPEAIKLARKMCPKAQFFVGDITEYSLLREFPDNSFDVVFTMAVLVHIPPGQVKKHINEMYRIAAKAVILIEPHAERVIRNRVLDRPISPFCIDNYKKYITVSKIENIRDSDYYCVITCIKG